MVRQIRAPREDRANSSLTRSSRSKEFAIVFMVLLALYAATACTTVGPGDSGALTVAMTTWGVTHAPGYPLLSLIGNLVSHALPFVESALALNLLNAVFAAAACATLAAAVRVATRSVAAGLIAGLALGVSRVFWQQALAIEVLSLNTWMAALLLYLLARWSSDASARPWWTIPVAVWVASTAVTHHLTLILAAGPVALGFLWAARSRSGSPSQSLGAGKVVGWSLAALAIGCLPLLYIPLAAAHDPTLNWGDARDLEGLVRHLMRRDFGAGTLTSPGLAASQVLMHGEAASPLGQRNFLAFWADLPRSLGWGTLALFAIGTVHTARQRRMWIVVQIAFLAAIALFFARVNTPMLPFYACVTERFYILPHLMFAFFAGWGAAVVVAWGRGRGWSPQLLTGGLLVLTVGPTLVAHAPVVNQRGNTFTLDLGRNLMAGMPDSAIFFSTGDLFRNSFLYQREGLGHRPDLSLVDQDLMVLPWYVSQLRRRGTLRLPEGMVAVTEDPRTGSATWLDANLAPGPDGKRRPAVAVKFLDDTYAARYRLEPRGLWSRVLARDAPIDLVRWEREVAGVIGAWTLRSMRRDYPEASWEAADAVFYGFALGQWMGLRDLISIVAPQAAPVDTPAALWECGKWGRARAADLLAYRADFLAQSLRDSLVAVDSRIDSVVRSRAAGHARAALDIAPGHVQALQTLALLTSLSGDRTDELEIRRRLVEVRPGDLGELISYLRLALELGRSPTADPNLLRRAGAARDRFLRLLGIAYRLHPSDQIPRVVAHWGRPLSEIPELQ